MSRVLWYLEDLEGIDPEAITKSQSDGSKGSNPSQGNVTVKQPNLLETAMQYVVCYLEKMGQEVFTSKSKGATSVLGFWAFTSYLFAILLYYQTAQWNVPNKSGYLCSWLPAGTSCWWVPGTNQIPCDTVHHCFINLMRLSFFDGCCSVRPHDRI